MITRRGLLHRIGAVGGLGAVYSAMLALGIEAPAGAATAPILPSSLGKGRKVIVLGAGIAGLVSAYELEQAGFEVTLLEARGRVGGRAWTLRPGDKVEMIGEETQTVGFSDGLYMNAGPARLPSFHQGMLGYARKFGVPMEVEVNSSRSAYIMANDGSRIRLRAAVSDMRGYVSELLAKALNQGALNQSVSPADKERLIPFLKAYGDLDGQGRFTGTDRDGFATVPGAGLTFGEAVKPLPLGQILGNEQLPMTLFDEVIYMQATMFQPVGGMDRIHAGFDRNLKAPAIRNAEVTKIGQSHKGVRVSYRDKTSGATRTLNADYLICTIPFPVLTKIPADFSAPVKNAISGVQYDHSNKVGFDAPRFWEADQIYGGLSFVGGETGLVWYPSAGIFGSRGMLLACYGSGPPAAQFEKRPLAEQIALARGVIERLHPGHGKDLSAPVAVNWRKIPYSLGPWPAWDPANAGKQEARIDTPGYRLLQQPDGRVYFATAALSQTPGWQEGGVQSAWAQVAAIAARVSAEAVVSPNKIVSAA